MFKHNVIEFIFNDNKFRVEKFFLLLVLGWAVIYSYTVFQVSLWVSVLILIIITSVIKITWYNRKENIKLRVIDWIGIILCFIVLTASVFLYLEENKLEHAINNVMEEKAGNESFTIEFIDEMKSEENYYVVGYTVEGDDTKYMEWYYWRNGELIHNLTRKIGDGNE
ncbi:hypothetical protein MUN88_07175 [Gracilibacillus caseinilyticus]|uniref:DUF4178 domain-containing protein n=1 Tax=Gracilibacillus caseinilyticus TaxID=2932256 RepID=A0ABY4F193_9BACI|nr:hypothetical protein [Gracilibacillus caseinilyticus]UOQ49848.1 hypothetical protein MUN88_07175 [Gracilibacillus caseinilyticus]